MRLTTPSVCSRSSTSSKQIKLKKQINRHCSFKNLVGCRTVSSQRALPLKMTPRQGSFRWMRVTSRCLTSSRVATSRKLEMYRSSHRSVPWPRRSLFQTSSLASRNQKIGKTWTNQCRKSPIKSKVRFLSLQQRHKSSQKDTLTHALPCLRSWSTLRPKDL